MPSLLSKAWAKTKLVAVPCKGKRHKGRNSPRSGESQILDKSSFESSVSISLLLPRDKFRDKIVGLWKEVWLGLYEIDLEESLFHYNRLQAFYCGAGLGFAPNGYIRIFEYHIYRHFIPQRWDNGIASLKLCDGMSVFTLQSIYEVLMAYQKEIPNLHQLYTLLGRKQLGLDGHLLEFRSPFETEVLVHEFNKIAWPMGKRLASIDERTKAVNSSLREELLEIKDKNGKSSEGRFIYQMAFPER